MAAPHQDRNKSKRSAEAAGFCRGWCPRTTPTLCACTSSKLSIKALDTRAHCHELFGGGGMDADGRVEVRLGGTRFDGHACQLHDLWRRVAGARPEAHAKS